MFKLNDVKFSLYIHLIDDKIFLVIVQKNITKVVQILRNFCFRHLTELNYFNIYHIIGKYIGNLAICRLKIEYQISLLKKLVIT